MAYIAKVWTVTVDEQQYRVEYDPRTIAGRKRILINGNPEALKIGFISNLAGLDHTVTLGRKIAHFVLMNGKADLAVDGYYLDSKKEYTPLKGIPFWAFLFLAACIAIPIYTLGGAIPAVIGFLGATLCVKVSLSPKFNLIVQLLICTGITGAAWLFILWFVDFMSNLV